MSIKSIVHVCDYCGEEHLITKEQNKKLTSGKQKKSFCSIKCKSLFQHNGENIKCENCEKEFYRRKYLIENNEHNFCSNECANEFRSKESKEIRICKYCNIEFETFKVSSQKFCSNRCNANWQSTLLGEDNPKFIRKLMPCEQCGKMHYVSNYMINNGSHFCSTECRQKWYAETWCQQEKWKEKSRNKILETLSSGKMTKTQSKPQKIVDELLNKLHIGFEREKNFDYYSTDNYLTDYNLIIEVQGDYWHCNPNKYVSKISNMQAKNIRRDKSKNTYINKYKDIRILYLWENDIYHNIDVCEHLINEYIHNEGKLRNYHSFNYIIKNNELFLKYNIVPYQELEFKDYKDKIEKVS